MRTVAIQMTVPEEMALYLRDSGQDQVFARNAMLLFPFIQNLTISHGRAAEILGVRKADLIEFYDSIGIPYLDQGADELVEDLAAVARARGEAL